MPQISFIDGMDEGELLQALGDAGYQTSLGDFTANGGDLIMVDGTLAGWLYQDDMGVLESLEILPQFRRQGIGKAVLDALYGGRPFKAFLPNDQGTALLQGYGDVNQGQDGYAVVTPRPTISAWVTSNCRFART